jgi:dihydroneopterin aldolase
VGISWLMKLVENSHGKEGLQMALASIELKDLKLQTEIGTYGPGAIIPKQHLLDLTLWIDAKLVLISEDTMAKVFDYDPLIIEIDKLAKDCHYETQERLITRIIEACAKYSEIKAMDIGLRKLPVRAGSGSLGVRLSVDSLTLNNYRDPSLSA